jgi:hypothetical protein
MEVSIKRAPKNYENNYILLIKKILIYSIDLHKIVSFS